MKHRCDITDAQPLFTLATMGLKVPVGYRCAICHHVFKDVADLVKHCKKGLFQ